MLSPLDLQNKKVVTKKRKYDKIEMDEYLDLVFENYKELYNQNQELQKQIKTLSDGVQYYRSIESTMQKALVLAEKTSKETKDAAVLKAEAIEKDANSKASKIISEANQEYESIKEKSLYLVQQFNQYKMQLKQVATAQLELITSDSFDVYSPELDAIRNAAYSLPTTDEQENITTFTDAPQNETDFNDTTVVDIPKDNLSETDILSKENDIVDAKNDLTSVIDAEPSPSVLIEDDMLAPVEEDNKKQMDKTVILPDLKGKLDKDKSSRRISDKDTMSILTADTIDLRTPFQEAQNESSASSETNGSVGGGSASTKNSATAEEPVDILSDFEPIQDTNVVNAQVKDADIVTPLDAGLQDIKPKKPEMLEPVAENEKDAPTLDSLLQNMNLGKKKKKKGQEEDPFEFLGSVDDF